MARRRKVGGQGGRGLVEILEAGGQLPRRGPPRVERPGQDVESTQVGAQAPGT